MALNTANLTDAQIRAVQALSDLSPPEKFWTDIETGAHAIRSQGGYSGCFVTVDSGTPGVNQKVLNMTDTGTGGTTY